MDIKLYQKASKLILGSGRTAAFTGAGISVESGIPPFRGEDGLWNQYDPVFLDITYFHKNSLKSWELIKEVFYDYFGRAEPNTAHYSLVQLEEKKLLQSIITQNIDNLHQRAGSTNVIEYHGTSHELICTKCHAKCFAQDKHLVNLPPECEICGGLLKPDFVFFGESIPVEAAANAADEAEQCDLFILVGTSGEIMPASIIPYNAKQNGAKIIEINTNPSNYSDSITDIFLRGKATDVFKTLLEVISESLTEL